MHIPTIGGKKGVFEIFIPGVFLLFNLIGFLCLLPFNDDNIKNKLNLLASHQFLLILVLISLGYLFGVSLSIIRTGPIDKWSTRFLKIQDLLKSFFFGINPNISAYEKFPYFRWVERHANERLPNNSVYFYYNLWGHPSRNNTIFFNYCKKIIIYNDELAANEIAATEAFSRYMANMFYALIPSIIMVLTCLFCCVIKNEKWSATLVTILFFYLFCLYEILKNFKIIRFREVMTVFGACFKNKSLFTE